MALEYFLPEFHGKGLTEEQIKEQEEKYAPRNKPFEFKVKRQKKQKMF